MNVFQLRDRLVSGYSDYVRSFIHIRDDRIRDLVDSELDEGLLWPDPLIQLNPSFESGGWIEDLVTEGVLHEECRRVFRLGKGSAGEPGGRPLRLHRHQAEAIRAARTGANYVLTTGTGSGKSLAYIIPIVDHVLRHGSGKGIQAVVVYPMNALANSQLGELEKFLHRGFPEGRSPVSFRRYTGQENDEEKRDVIQNPPDILLTNYVMLELILTRPEERALVDQARGLRFLVLDELHTYRGRQGADVAMLVRRAREAFQSPNLQCVGTSATLASEGTQEEQRTEIARVATRLFGASVEPDHVIGETVQRATPEHALDDPAFVSGLRQRVADASRRPPHDYQGFVSDPLSIWIESTFGLRSELGSGRLTRAKPRSIAGSDGAATELSKLTGVPAAACASAIEEQLLASYGSEHHPETGFPVFAFRLHQFIGRGDTVYASIEPEAERHMTVQGQRLAPGGGEKVLLPLVFCRECGQEYYCVRKGQETESGATLFEPRELLDRSDDNDTRAGFLYLSTKDPWPESTEEVLDRLPEDWIEEAKSNQVVRRDRRDKLPKQVLVGLDGRVNESGIACHFFPAPFLFCLRCGVAYGARQRSDFAKLTSLATEGRSTATTILTLAAIRYLRGDTTLAERARKILSFTDNRQDASLQAGHFNDFVEVGLLRSALYKAVVDAGPAGLRHEDLALAVFQTLDLPLALYASNPEARFQALEDTNRAFRSVLAYRLYRDLERGWRITSPNLEQCGLLEIGYASLEELCEAEDLWTSRHPALASASPETRAAVAHTLLDLMRRELAIKVDCLQAETQERIVQQSSQRLVEPWAIDENEQLEKAAVLVPRSRASGDYRGYFYLSPRSGFGQYLGRREIFPDHSERIRLEDRRRICLDLLDLLRQAGIVEEVSPARGEEDVPGYQIVASSLVWKAGDGTRAYRDPIRVPRPADTGGRTNPFFIEYYRSIAEEGKGLRAREHTAGVPAPTREEREDAFREGRLPILYCSPTMELGVDIAELNAVNLRNVPPTPANYAQRSGRAGRSGQPAIVFSYCSNWSPHDQYFFRRPDQMVSGAVAPPRLDLANEDLIRAHVQAVWLAETRVPLSATLANLLDLSGEDPSLGILPSLRSGLEERAALERARTRARRILEGIASDLAAAAWHDEGWLDRTLDAVLLGFDSACDRWRGLYQAAKRQQAQQNRVILDASRSPEDRKRARILRAEAESQLTLLTQAENVIQADFYSYRYFASEGFLPGYNFPRLPLSAYIPGRRERGGRDEFLSRPRFLAISEFGPRAIVYHEGVRYQINRVILSSARRGEADAIVTAQAKLCEACGYLHEWHQGEGPDLCERCDATLGAPLTSLFRLQNVSTKRRDRISSDEEERLRVGYEIRTGVRFERRAGQLSARTAHVLRDGDPLLTLTYGDAALLWRINVGERRRAHPEECGFVLDIERGYWAKSRQEGGGEDAEDPMSARTRLVIPYVEDHRNCLLLEPAQPLEPEVMASLQAALKRAIQVVFQLEDTELAAEPLPSYEERRLILLYESAEGGAGALRRLIDDPRALERVARTALEVCHFDPATGEDRRRAPRSKEDCEAACYDCLMSYVNQPDHRRLDRRRVRDLLLAIASSEVEVSAAPRSRGEHLAALLRRCASQFEREWLQFLEEHRLDLPTHAQERIDAANTRPDFLYADHHVAIYVDGASHEFPDRKERDAQQTEALEDLGYTVLRFGAREEWVDLIRRHPSIFGPMPPEPDRTEPAEGFDPGLFPADWQTLLRRLAAIDGVRVEPGGDVSGSRGVAGRFVAEIHSAKGATLRILDSRDVAAKEAERALEEAGHATLSLDPNDAGVWERLRSALGVA